MSRALTSSSAVRSSSPQRSSDVRAHQRDDVLRRLQAAVVDQQHRSAPRPAARRSSRAARRRSARTAAPPPSPPATACSAPRRTPARRPPRARRRQNGRSGHSGGPPKTSVGARSARSDSCPTPFSAAANAVVTAKPFWSSRLARRRGRSTPAVLERRGEHAPASPRASRRRVVVRRPGERQRRAQVVDDDVDDALLQRRRHDLARADPVLHGDRQPGAAGRLGVDLDQDLVLLEVVGGEPDRRRRRRRGVRSSDPPQAARSEQQDGAERRRVPTAHGGSSRAGARARGHRNAGRGRKGMVGAARTGAASADMASLPQAPPEPGARRPGRRPGPPAIQRVRAPASSLRRTSPAAAAPQRVRASGGWRLSALVVVGLGGRRRSRAPSPCSTSSTPAILQAISEIRTPWLTRVAEVAGRAGHARRRIHVLWLTNLRPARRSSAGGGTCSSGSASASLVVNIGAVTGQRAAAAPALRGRDPRRAGRASRCPRCR